MLPVAGCRCDGQGAAPHAAASDDAVGGPANGPQVHAVLHVVLLQLGQDVFAVGVFAQGGDVRPDLGDKRRGEWVLELDLQPRGR